jgi:mono/diheme cytochrome c family protein
MKGLRLLVLFSASCFLMAELEASLTSAASGDPTKGKALYANNCLICHGERGKGDGLIGASLSPPPTDLSSSQVQAKPDKDLLTVIREGRAVMPAWKNRLNDQDIQNILVYIRSLSQ